MEKEIKQEKNVILQCLRYIVDNDYFGKGTKSIAEPTEKLAEHNKAEPEQVLSANIMLVEPVAHQEELIVHQEEPMVNQEEPVVKEEPIVHQEEPVVNQEEPIVHEEEPVVHQEKPVVPQEEEVDAMMIDQTNTTDV